MSKEALQRYYNSIRNRTVDKNGDCSHCGWDVGKTPTDCGCANTVRIDDLEAKLNYINDVLKMPPEELAKVHYSIMHEKIGGITVKWENVDSRTKQDLALYASKYLEAINRLIAEGMKKEEK